MPNESKELTPEELETVQKMKEVLEKAKNYNLSDDIYSLLNEEYFLAALSRDISKVPDYRIPTAGVCITENGYFELRYNPAFMVQMDKKHRKGVLKHEFFHIIFGHLTSRFRKTDLNTDGLRKKWNYATDLAINSMIPDELPDWALLPGRGLLDGKTPEELEKIKGRIGEKLFGEYVNLSDTIKGFPRDNAAEWYMSALPDLPEDPNEGSGENGQGGDPKEDPNGSVGDHSGWGKASEESRALAEERCKDMISRAAKEANVRGWGNISAGCKEAILSRLEAKINWKSVLRMFVGSVMRGEAQKTPKRLNKRFPYILPGQKRKRYANIMVAIDESGSVGDDLLVQFFSELDHLAQLVTFTVVPFDCSIDEKLIYTWKKGTHRQVRRDLTGGTNFSIPTEYCNKSRSYDALVILTDLQAEKPCNCRVPRIWITDKSGKDNIPFETSERVLVIDKDLNR